MSDGAEVSTLQVHSPHLGYRVARGLRCLRRLRGWTRCVGILAPDTRADEFLIANRGIAFQGNTRSFVDRQIYLFGGYEIEAIDLFLSLVPRRRRGTVLDVGANVGTHALSFARHFQRVHSFEPNAALWSAFERNLAANRQTNVTLHRIGLADSAADRTFYTIAKDNYGLGTFSSIEQYDLPLQAIGTFRVEKGDEYLVRSNVGSIDAIKIDVQGYEPEVLLGLQETLRRDRPIVWFEYGAGTKTKSHNTASVRELFPYDIELLAIRPKQWLAFHSTRLERVAGSELPPGDYIAVPVMKN